MSSKSQDLNEGNTDSIRIIHDHDEDFVMHCHLPKDVETFSFYKRAGDVPNQALLDAHNNFPEGIQEFIEATRETLIMQHRDELAAVKLSHSKELHELRMMIRSLEAENDELHIQIHTLRDQADFSSSDHHRLERLEETLNERYNSLEFQLIEKFKKETEQFMQKVEEEMHQVLTTKGITKDRIQEIEDEVRNNAKASLEGIAKFDLTFRKTEDIDKIIDHTNHNQAQLKMLVAKEKAKLIDKFNQKEKELYQEIEKERLHLCRQKSNLNVQFRKAKEISKKYELKLDSEREASRSLVNRLRIEIDLLKQEIAIRQKTNKAPEYELEQISDETSRTEEEEELPEVFEAPNPNIIIKNLLGQKIDIIEEVNESSTNKPMEPQLHNKMIDKIADDDFFLKEGNLIDLASDLLQHAQNDSLEGVNISDYYDQNLNEPDLLYDESPTISNEFQKNNHEELPLSSRRHEDNKLGTEEHIEYVKALEFRSKTERHSRNSFYSEREEFDHNIFDDVFSLDRQVDSEKDTEMKLLRFKIDEIMHSDSLHMAEVVRLSQYIVTGFLPLLQGFLEHSKSTVVHYMQSLISLMKTCFISYEERLGILTHLTDSKSLSQLLTRLKVEEQNLKAYSKSNPLLLTLLSKREAIRSKILAASYDFKSAFLIRDFTRRTSKLYRELAKLNGKLLSLSASSSRTSNHQFRYFGVLVEALYRIDFWEDEYLQKFEGRLAALEFKAGKHKCC